MYCVWTFTCIVHFELLFRLKGTNKIPKRIEYILERNLENLSVWIMWNDHWSIMKPAYFIIWFSFNINFRFSIKWCSRAQMVIWHKYVKYTCSMETVQQNGRFTLFSSKFPSNIYSITLQNSYWGIVWIPVHSNLCSVEAACNQSVQHFHCSGW